MDVVLLAARVLLEFFLWFMAGRLVLAVLSGGKQTFFTELFRKATYPPIWVVRRLTPSTVGDQHIPLLTIPILLTLLILVRTA